MSEEGRGTDAFAYPKAPPPPPPPPPEPQAAATNGTRPDEAGDCSAGPISARKRNTVAKLIEKHWNGRITAEVLEQRLSPELWAEIQSSDSKEEMLRRARAAGNKATKVWSQEKAATRRGVRLCEGQTLLDKYGLLAAPASELPLDSCWRPDWKHSMPRPCVPEFNCWPLRGYFERREWLLLRRELSKLHEKRRQIEYLVGLVVAKLDARRHAGLPALRVVDFAGGRGDLALALAWLFRERGLGETVTLVELQPQYVEQARRRAREANLLGTLCFESMDLRDYQETFDLAVACHACGGLTDLILSKCLDAVQADGAPSFVLLTCCFGKIRKQHKALGLRVPTAGGTAIETSADFWALCGMADSAKPRESAMAMRVLNSDRLARCRRTGVWAELRAIPREVTNKNLIILDAWPALRERDREVAHEGGGPNGIIAPRFPRPLPLNPSSPNLTPKPSNHFRVVAVSDTHGRHDSIFVPPADLLVHCGDFTKAGEEAEVRDFAIWFAAQPCKHKILVAGNHEVTFDEEYFCREGWRFHGRNLSEGPGGHAAAAARCRAVLKELCPEALLLESGGTAQVGPLMVWGSPCQGSFFSGHSMAAFTLPPDGDWPGIPDGVDVVVTHGPPFGIGDLSGEKAPSPQRAGCPRLRHRVQQARPALHLFGHIHEGYGAYSDQEPGGTIYINAAVCTERYLATRLAVVTDLPLLASPTGGVDRAVASDVWLAARPGTEEAEKEALTAEGSKAEGGGEERDGNNEADGEPTPLFQRLVGALHGHPALHAASSTSAYRNKASYLLGSHFGAENPWCDPILNKVAACLQRLATEYGRSSDQVDGDGSVVGPCTWVEASLKVTRASKVGVKLLLRGFRASTQEPDWLPLLLAECPEVTSVSVQTCPEGSTAKPAKSPWDPRYVDPVPLYGPMYVVEQAPPEFPGAERPGVEFRLSPDAFSEVNSAAEDAMFERVLVWAKQMRAECPRLALLGRNSGFYGLALQRECRFEEVRGCTHCPQTAADAEASIDWHAGADWLPGGAKTFRFSRISKSGFFAQLRALSGGPPTVVHVTNNRHGLAAGVVRALAETPEVRAVLYNSCNHRCLPGEWAQFCSSGFEISDFASSDLLAGTEYDSSIFLLKRRPRTLVLPIAPPACGKSIVARCLAAEGGRKLATASSKRTPGACSYLPRHGGSGAHTAACTELVEVFERDRRFSMERDGQGGLKAAKARTHVALLDALGRAAGQPSSVLYVDSTNGARSARLAYRCRMQPERTVYVLLGLADAVDRPAEAKEALLRRVMARSRSAACPAHEVRQWEDAVRSGLGPKLHRMLEAIQPPDDGELGAEGVSVVRCGHLPSDEDTEKVLWHLFVMLCCPALFRADRMDEALPVLPRPSLTLGGTGPLCGRVALCFLTSARSTCTREMAPGSLGLWNDAAWQWLARDFEDQSGRRFEECFCVLRHDDTVAAGTALASAPAGDFLRLATRVRSVPTARATTSLVLAELSLIRAALDAGCDSAVLLSESCLPLRRLATLRQRLLQGGRSVAFFHFLRGGYQRLFGIRYGASQWKAWHRPEMALLASLGDDAILARWRPLEAGLSKYNLAPDEVALVNEIHERGGDPSVGSLEARCDRRATTYVEWEEPGMVDDGPRHARVFKSGVPEAAWSARDAGVGTVIAAGTARAKVVASANGADAATYGGGWPMFCRKVAPLGAGLEAWKARLDV